MWIYNLAAIDIFVSADFLWLALLKNMKNNNILNLCKKIYIFILCKFQEFEQKLQNITTKYPILTS